MSLRRLYDLDEPFPRQLDQLLHDQEYVDELRELPEPELSQLVDHLNDILVRLDRTGGQSRKCLHVLRRICGARKVLPATYELSRGLSPSSQLPTAFGGFCEAYEGTLSEKVCIKRLRISEDCDLEKIKEQFCKEAVVWRHLNHPNIVPFRGVTLDPPQLISEWMPGGELREYVRNNRDANLITLSLGIAKGLAYLHSRGVIHGDFKGTNILVDTSGTARITDFGLATIVRDPNSFASTSENKDHSLRWMAPEILESGQVATKESDVFSFAMVMIEVFTGEIPFKRAPSSEVVMRLAGGERPGRPTHPIFTDPLWELTQRCWGMPAQDRPKMEDVLEELDGSQVTGSLQMPSRELPEAMSNHQTAVSGKSSTESGFEPPPVPPKERVSANEGLNAGREITPGVPTKKHGVLYGARTRVLHVLKNLRR